MNKLAKITIIFVLLFLANTSSANAAIFTWNTRLPFPSILAANIGTNWSFTSMANKSAEMKSAKAMIAEAIDKPVLQIIKTYKVRASAYSSTIDQTDDSPFVTAAGTYVRDGIIAANFLPFGTQIRIPEVYGDKVFVVEDRMNKRYWYNIDIWFSERQLAREFGVKNVTIEVVSELSES